MASGIRVYLYDYVKRVGFRFGAFWMARAGTERAEFIATLRSQDPDLASELKLLLDAHDTAGSERFLEESPAPPAGLVVAAGQAFRAMGQDEDARSALRMAVKHLESALGPDHLRVREARMLLGAG